ncbi:MAG: HAD family phosphatase [Treponemataceae bacterium]|nr:HAD family phosphatase [Treponemataceae bacterium]
MLFIFDMGGVVTQNTPPEAKIAQTLGISVEEFRVAQKLGEKENLFSLLSRGKISEEEFWREVGANIGKKIDANLWQLFFHPKMNSDVKKIILSLRKKNHRVVCGTNTIESHWQCHVARGDYAIFDETYASQKIGFEKPDADFWKTILLSEGYSPNETFFTDDREKNVEAARAIGIASHKFENASALKKAIREFLKREKNSR